MENELSEAYEKRLAEWLLNKLYAAYLKARKGKRRTNDEHVFEVNALENLMILRDAIMLRTYEPSRGIAFITFKPVTREIFAAPFRDRVVHHFLFDQVYDWWDARLIYDSYSCRKGKGTKFGIDRLQSHIRKVSQNYEKEAYVIKLDVQGYFMSLPRRKLYERALWGLKQQFPEGGARYEMCKYLWHKIIMDDPIEGVKRRGSLSDWRKLPRSKSLFCQPPGQGIVIGNLSSQLLSNIYLDQLDRFITLELGYKHYGRYVDDFYMVVTAEELPQARKDIRVIEEFLRSIGLTLHPKKRYIQEVHKGVEFLGALIYPRCLIPGRRLKRNFRKAAYSYMYNDHEAARVQSYLGHLKYFDARKLEEEIFNELGWEYRF